MKIILDLGIPADSDIATKIFKNINARTDNLTVKDKICLYSILNEMLPQTDEHTDTKMILLKRFHRSTDWEFELLTMSDLADIFSVVVTCKEPTFSNERILPIIEMLWRKRHMLNDDEAKKVLSSLLKIDMIWAKYHLLFELCLRRINCPSELDFLDLIRIIEMIDTLKKSSEVTVIHTEEFLSKCAEMAVKSEIGPIKAEQLCEKLKIIVSSFLINFYITIFK